MGKRHKHALSKSHQGNVHSSHKSNVEKVLTGKGWSYASSSKVFAVFLVILCPSVGSSHNLLKPCRIITAKKEVPSVDQ